jgi:3-oxoacyl-[acyl-carrier protein] reductase
MSGKRNALVTGGLQGIGRAIVRKLMQRGDSLFVFDLAPVDDERVKQLQDEGVFYCQVDVGSYTSIERGFAQITSILDQQEHKSLDILINNAGITRDGIALRIKESDWDAVCNVNLKGAFFCAQKALAHMMRQSKGYIINISSIVGLRGNPGQANYAASKAGLIALTKTLAFEYARRNVVVNAIAPGFIQTAMTEKMNPDQKKQVRELIALKRFGTADDIAYVAAFLTSGDADYITGQVIEVNGGMW